MGLKEGNIYFWSYKELWEGGDPYWCKSRIAIVKNGRLKDTYSGGGHNDTTLDLDEVDLEYQGNLDDLVNIPKHQIKYYRKEDIVNLTHANSYGSQIYLKKGAQKDVDAIRSELNGRRNEANREISHAVSRLEYLQRQLLLLEQGKIDEVYL